MWEVAGATGSGAYGNKIRPALALAHLASGSLALIGTRPRDTGNPAVGSLIAIDIANGLVRWTADNVTPHSIFVDDAAGVAVVGIEAPWDVPFSFTNVNNVSYTIGFRGYSLAQGGAVVWDNTSASSVSHSSHSGCTVGPRACEVAYGQPCDLIAATPIGLSSFVMKTSTGQSICPLPSHPATGYAIDTVNGVEYSVEDGELIATAAGTTGAQTAPRMGIELNANGAPRARSSSRILFSSGATQCRFAPAPRSPRLSLRCDVVRESRAKRPSR